MKKSLNAYFYGKFNPTEIVNTQLLDIALDISFLMALGFAKKFRTILKRSIDFRLTEEKKCKSGYKFYA